MPDQRGDGNWPAWKPLDPSGGPPLTERLIRKFISKIKTQMGVDAARERVRRDRIAREGCPHDGIYMFMRDGVTEDIRCNDCDLSGYALRLELGLE